VVSPALFIIEKISFANYNISNVYFKMKIILPSRELGNFSFLLTTNFTPKYFKNLKRRKND